MWKTFTLNYRWCLFSLDIILASTRISNVEPCNVGHMYKTQNFSILSECFRKLCVGFFVSCLCWCVVPCPCQRVYAHPIFSVLMYWKFHCFYYSRDKHKSQEVSILLNHQHTSSIYSIFWIPSSETVSRWTKNLLSKVILQLKVCRSIWRSTIPIPWFKISIWVYWYGPMLLNIGNIGH